MKKVSFALIAAVAVFLFAQTPFEKASSQERRWILKGQESIKEKLKDPESAKFKDVFFSDLGGVPVTCGQVNSKNSFNGYTGFQKFISAGSPSRSFLEEEVSDFYKMWDQYCK